MVWQNGSSTLVKNSPGSDFEANILCLGCWVKVIWTDLWTVPSKWIRHEIWFFECFTLNGFVDSTIDMDTSFDFAMNVRWVIKRQCNIWFFECSTLCGVLIRTLWIDTGSYFESNMFWLGSDFESNMLKWTGLMCHFERICGKYNRNGYKVWLWNECSLSDKTEMYHLIFWVFHIIWVWNFNWCLIKQSDTDCDEPCL